MQQMEALNPAISSLPNFHHAPPPGRRNLVTQPHAVKVSPEFSSTIGRIIDEDEYRKARAEVFRKRFHVEGYSVEGMSIGGHETCVIVPELKSAGRCVPKAVNQNFLFITHAHLDHIGGQPNYIATRALYSLKPPTVFVPTCIKENVEKLIDIHRETCQTVGRKTIKKSMKRA